MLNALSKYVSGYLKKPPQQPSGTADPIDKSADDDSGLPPDQDLFETVGKVVVGLDLGLKEDFPILEPKATITTQEVENAEWIFVADKTGTADKNNKALHARLDEETKTPSYASTAAKAPPPPPPISTPQQYNKKTSTVSLGNGAKVELKKQIAQGRINCDNNNNNYEINRSPLINSESKDGGFPSHRSVKNAGTQFPASRILSNRTPGVNVNSRKNNNSNNTSKNTSAFLFIDTNMHSGDKFDHENGAVLLNENRLITLTEKVDSVDRELDKALLPPHGSSCRKNGGFSSKSAGLRASLKSLKSELKAVNTPTSLVLVRGRGTPKKEESSNFDQSKEVAAKWEISDKYRKVDSLRRRNYHCFLLPEEEDCLTPDEDGEEYLTHKTSARGGGKKGGGRRRGIRTGDGDDEQQRNATTTQAADSTSAASVPITTNASGRTRKPTIRAARPSTTPMVRALTKFHDTWDRKKGHGDKAKTFNQAQKEAFKSYRRRHRNTDSTNSSASSADVNINTCLNNDYPSAFSLKQLLGKKLKSVRREQSKNKKIKKSSTNSLFKQDEGTNLTGNLNSCGSLNLEIPITIDPYSVKNPNMDSSYHTADFSSNVISSPTLATNTVGKKNLQHSDALTFFQACDRHFSRKYLARKKKAVSQRRNPYNGKFMQYMTSSALLAASSDNNTPAITIGPLNRGDLIEGGLSQQKDAVEARKSKKHNGGRFYYAQKNYFELYEKAFRRWWW